MSHLSQEDVSAQDRFLLCKVWHHAPIIRDATGPYAKWAVVAGEVGEEETEYPPYCSGWLYITSPDTARNLALQVHMVVLLFSADACCQAAREKRMFWIDDVWVTGYLARQLGIQHTDFSPYWTMQSGPLLDNKVPDRNTDHRNNRRPQLQQSPARFHPDFIGGPTGRDLNLSLRLQDKAEWCFTQRCWNNIYNIVSE